MESSNVKLSHRIFDCLSDGYDDEEDREETVEKLEHELSLSQNTNIRLAFLLLCERVEELLA